jgi:hypothetical protein
VKIILRDDGFTETLWAVRVAADEDHFLDAITALGCSFEGFADITKSITVPSTVALERVADYLTSTGLAWEYADPKHEDLFGPT